MTQKELVDQFCKFRGKCTTDDVVALNFAYSTLAPHWISVEDELPPMRDMSRQSEAVLVLCAYTEKQMAYRERILYNPKKYCYRIGLYDYEVKGWFFEQVGEFTPTHWMPLPQPPKEGGEK